MDQPSTQVSSSKIVMALLQNSVPSATGVETGSVHTGAPVSAEHCLLTLICFSKSLNLGSTHHHVTCNPDILGLSWGD